MHWAENAILMDEPTAALGARQTEIVVETIRAVAERGLGVLLVSHDMPRMLGLADRIVVLRHGAVVADLQVRRRDDPADRVGDARRHPGAGRWTQLTPSRWPTRSGRRRPPRRERRGSTLARHPALWIAAVDVLLIVGFGVFSQNHVFFNGSNFTNMALDSAQVVMLAVGSAMLLGAAELDISLGANVILSSVRRRRA